MFSFRHANVHCFSFERLSCERKVLAMARKYQPVFLNYGFTLNIDKHNVHRPQCVICLDVLANESLRPQKLKRHLEKKHGDHVNKSWELFLRKEREMNNSKSVTSSAVFAVEGTDQSQLPGGGENSQRKETIHDCGATHPAMCQGDVQRSAWRDGGFQDKHHPLSADMIHQLIIDMGEDIEHQLYANREANKFAIQLDESMDIAQKALILIFVRYRHGDDFMEDLLACDELQTRTTVAEIFAVINKHIALHSLRWEDCVGVCTDGAASMTGRRSGVIKLIQDVAPEASWTHCFLNREALAAKEMSPGLAEVMDIAVKTINHLRKSTLNSRLFAELCKEQDAEHTTALYFAAVRWLSRGDALARLYELRDQVLTFLEVARSYLAVYYKNNKFIATLAYMADIFNLLNNLNISFQGKTNKQAKSVFVMYDKIAAFKSKLDLWKRRVQANDEFDMFENLDDLLSKRVEERVDIKDVIVEHLVNLRKRFDEYFPVDPRVENKWIRDPYSVDVQQCCNLSKRLKEDLIGIVSDGTLETLFRKDTLVKFWLTVSHEYPEIAHLAVKFLMPFTMTWMCEAGFSTVTCLMSKYRNKLETVALCANLRIALSPLQSRIDDLVANMQSQPSH
uniref:SCAN domain-containing protein 3-like n=1 Tax=Myxine glutinosa TaxID=7769 RepID=UPI00358F5488